MGKQKKNIIGETFGEWTVIGETNKTNRSGSYWLCKCDCGIERVVFNGTLRTGKSKSCGCSRLKDKRRDKYFNSKYEIKDNGCWEWIGSRDRKGYSRFGIKTKAYRYSYEKFKGKIPQNMSICHSCDNKGCVNPNHLFLGTNEENQEDKVKKNRQAKEESHGRSKLTRENVIDIREKIIKGVGCRYLANQYHVTIGLIYHIRDRKIWKNLP